MLRRELVLAALASAGPEINFTPVKVQKLFFLLDREMAKLTKGPHFDYQPYDYGPFDRSVYETLEELNRDGLIVIDESRTYRRYSLTAEGYTQGCLALANAPKSLQEYMRALTSWLGRVSFAQLVSEIYKRYPDTKVNSVFRQ